LRADPEHGGAGEGLLTTCLVTEALARACPSTALIYKMHLESIEMISRVPTPLQSSEVVPKLAAGTWLSTVAGSETGHQGGAWAGGPKSAVDKVDGGYRVANIHKSFVTAAGIADSYFFMCRLEEEGQRPQQLMFQLGTGDLAWKVDEPWDGLGMRGNHSSPMTFDGFIPDDRLINPDNQRVDFFPVVLGTYAATYLGIAAGCFDHVLAHVGGSTLADGRRMGEVETIQTRVANCKVEIERSRALLYAACAAFDEGRHGGPMPFYEAKVACDQLGAFVTSEAMTLGGGAAFAKRLPFERYFRDARAGLVMGLAHDVAVLTIGKLLFPKPKTPKAESA
jgi:alkylation response protein AidB-like acyl-CoA dehydrogenase